MGIFFKKKPSPFLESDEVKNSREPIVAIDNREGMHKNKFVVARGGEIKCGFYDNRIQAQRALKKYTKKGSC